MKPNKLTTLTTLSTIALLVAPLAAQDFGQSGLNRPLTLAPADATSSSGGGAEVDDEKAKAAALAKATLNPVASLISVPFQNNFDWGAGPNNDGFQYKRLNEVMVGDEVTADYYVSLAGEFRAPTE